MFRALVLGLVVLFAGCGWYESGKKAIGLGPTEEQIQTEKEAAFQKEREAAVQRLKDAEYDNLQYYKTPVKACLALVVASTTM